MSNKRKWIYSPLWEVFCIIILVLILFYYFCSSRYVFDDAYMFVRYARNLLDGKGYVWNPGGPRVDGLTSPLWMLSIMGVFKMFPVSWENPEDALVLCSFFWAITLLLVLFFTARRLLPPPWKKMAVLAPLAGLLGPFEAKLHATTGMETNMAATLLLLYILFLSYERNTSQSLVKSAALGFLGFACYLVRPEFGLVILFSPALLAFSLYLSKEKNFFRGPLITFLVSLFCLFIYFIIRKFYFGRVLPCSFYVKGSLWFMPYEKFDQEERLRLFTIPFLFLKNSLFVHLILLFCLIRSKNWLKLIYIWFPVYLSLVYLSTILQIMGYGYRYYYPYIFVLFILIILSLKKEKEQPETGRPSGGGIVPSLCPFAAFVLLFILYTGYLSFGQLPFLYKKKKKDVFAKIIKILPPGISVAATEVGKLSAMNPRIIVHDLSGLNDSEFCGGFDPDVLFDRNPDILSLIHDHYHGMIHRIKKHPRFQSYLCAVNLSLWEKNSSFMSCIYINIDSPRIENILQALRTSGIAEDIGAIGGKFGFQSNRKSLFESGNRDIVPFTCVGLGANTDSGIKNYMVIDPCDPFSLLMGVGWHIPETWKGFGCARAMNHTFASFFIPVDSPAPLRLSLSFFPYKPDISPPLNLMISWNDNLLPEDYIPLTGVNNHSWIIPQKLVTKGINKVSLIANRVLIPWKVEPSSQDPRPICIWIHSIECSIVKDAKLQM